MQGEDNAPPICKACLNSLKKFYPDYQINVVTLQNINSFANFPHYVIEKLNAGKISPTHFSDILRLELLTNYGGIWIDSTVLCTGREEKFLQEPLFIFQSILANQPAHLGSNWFIVSEKGNPIVKTTRDLIYKFWQDHDYLGDAGFYFVFHCLFKLAAQKYPALFLNIPVFSNITANTLWFHLFRKYDEKIFVKLKSMSNFHKLTYKYKHPQNIEGTLAEKILKEYLPQ